jgi:N-acetylglucosaminyldiphosphoundecaprenol N-acetyl-beta-D-mannosaminyltransferase
MEVHPVTSAARMRNDRGDVLGVGVSAITMEDAIATLERWIGEGRREYVCVTGVHGVMESQRSEAIRRIHNGAGMVTPDGMPIVWLLRLAGHKYADRVYGPDLMRLLLRHSETRGYTHYLYGASESTLLRLQSRLATEYVGAQIVGAYSPPFRDVSDAEDKCIVEKINHANPDIVWIGLSTPKQECWMAAHRSLLDARVLIGVGAAFDFLAGTVKQAPRVIQRSGFEWLYRLCLEPRRLWKRYAVNNSRFILLIIADIAGWKRFTD